MNLNLMNAGANYLVRRTKNNPLRSGGKGHAVAQLVEATSRKVAGSISYGVIGIFY
jgi:hypothetical protein